MRNFEGLAEIIAFILTQNFFVKPIHCFKLLTRDDGSRILIEEMKGVSIEDLELYDSNTIIVRQRSHGTFFRGKIVRIFEATTYLVDVIGVNVYDYLIEFFSRSSMDFVCLQHTSDVKAVMLAEWIHDVPKILRAQWFRDDETESLLSEVGTDKRISTLAHVGRPLDLRDNI